MTRIKIYAIALAITLQASATGDSLSTLMLVDHFDASVTVPGITIGGVFLDDEADKLFLAGGTDLVQQARIRTFTTGGSFLQEVDVAGASGLGGIAGSLASDDLIAVEELRFRETASETAIYRLARDGSIINTRVLDNSFVPNGIFAGAVAINPLTGNIWVAESIAEHDNFYELDADFNLVRSVNTASLGVDDLVGLDIDSNTGNFIATDALLGLVELKGDLSAVLSIFPLNSIVDSPNSVAIGHGSGRLFVSSGSTDEVFEFRGYLVPEPATFSLFVVGGLILVGRRRTWRADLSARSHRFETAAELTGPACVARDGYSATSNSVRASVIMPVLEVSPGL